MVSKFYFHFWNGFIKLAIQSVDIFTLPSFFLGLLHQIIALHVNHNDLHLIYVTDIMSIFCHNTSLLLHFPVFGGTVGIQLIAEEDPRKKYLLAASNGTNITAPIRDVDLSYCSVKTGVNDLLDYMAISVSLIIPFVIGPLIVGVFQVNWIYF